MKALGVIIAILFIILYIFLFVFGIIKLKKKKYWQALKMYLFRYVFSLSLIFIGFLPLYLMTKDASFSIYNLRLPYLMLLLFIPYIYDFIFLKKIKESLDLFKDYDKEKEEYLELDKENGITKIEIWFTGKFTIYWMCFLSIMLYFLVYLFIYSYVEAIVRL